MPACLVMGIVRSEPGVVAADGTASVRKAIQIRVVLRFNECIHTLLVRLHWSDVFELFFT